MKVKRKQIGIGMILIGLVLFIAPSIGLLTFVSGPTTLYCSGWNPQEWSYSLFPGNDITPIAGCVIENGYVSHTCTTGSAVCLEKDSNNFCSHWQCPSTQTTCSNTCATDQLQKAYPDCTCFSQQTPGPQPFVDKSAFQILGGILVIGGVLVMRK